ncbi:uncharacterized protein DS421_20g697750 [Arachis hypogaea]|nr:uncharacterized protein DS421_20g697750 [Arachis hypogaea]
MGNRMSKKERSEVEFMAFLIERIALVFIAIVTASIWWPCAAHTVATCPSTDDPHTWSFISLVLFTYTIISAFYVFRWFYTVVATTQMSLWVGRILFILERLPVVVMPAAVLWKCIFVNPTFLIINSAKREEEEEKDHDNGKDQEEEEKKEEVHKSEDEFKEVEWVEEEEEEVHTSDDEFKEVECVKEEEEEE